MPKPSYISIIQVAASPITPLIEINAKVGKEHHGASGAATGTPAPLKQTSGNTYKCIFYQRRFTRKGIMWNCVERHLQHYKSGGVPYPSPEYKSKGFLLENVILFKNHTKRIHGINLRPPKIILRTHIANNRPAPKPKIIIQRTIKSRSEPR